MRLELHKVHFWYWTLCWLALVGGLAGVPGAHAALIAVAVVQLVHFRIREGRTEALSVQVRITALVVFTAGLWVPALHAVAAVGLFFRITTTYCTMARLLLLMPWNRGDEGLTWAVVRDVMMRPTTGGALEIRAPVGP